MKAASGCNPLSGRTRRRLLRDLVARADAGDAAAAGELIRLSLPRSGDSRASAATEGVPTAVTEQALPAMFTCPRMQVRLSETGCARMFRSTLERKPEPHEGRHHCVACPIGAGHAGISISPIAGTVERLGPICPRCRRPAARIINGRLCVSCYNRNREAVAGRNAKGHPPRLMAELGQRRIAVSSAGETRMVTEDAVSVAEVMILTAKAAAGPVSFSLPAAALLLEAA